MKRIILHKTTKLPQWANLVAAIGVFDGVHRGHQRLIRLMIARARARQGTSAVITFFPHPMHVLHPHKEVSLLVSLEHRLQLMEQLGVDVGIVIPFTPRLARVSAQDFIYRYLAQKINVKEIFIGQNFHFGRRQQGTPELLRSIAARYQIKAHILKSVCYQGLVISSSRLRTLMQQGNLSLARKYLGREIVISGCVVRGDGRGKHFGVPTANMNCGPEILPPLGVYAVKVKLGSRIYQGIANVGYRPSFRTAHIKNVEVHIFNFHRNIYGRHIEVNFLRKIRPEKKFSSSVDFINQIRQDEQSALSFFARLGR